VKPLRDSKQASRGEAQAPPSQRGREARREAESQARATRQRACFSSIGSSVWQERERRGGQQEGEAGGEEEVGEGVQLPVEEGGDQGEEEDQGEEVEHPPQVVQDDPPVPPREAEEQVGHLIGRRGSPPESRGRPEGGGGRRR